MEPRDLGDAIGGARVKGCGLVLRHLGHVAEHLARGGEIEATLRGAITKGGKHMVRAVDVGVERRKLVLERVDDKTLCGQVIAFLWMHRVEHAIDARKTLERRRVTAQAIFDGKNAPEPMCWVFESNTSNGAMHLI